MTALAPASVVAPPTVPAAPLKRITFLIRDLGFGGAQRQLVTLARGLHNQSFHVSVVHFYDGPLAAELDAAGVPHHLVGKSGRWDLPRFFVQLRRVLRQTRPDLLHSYLTESNVMASLCRKACGNPKVIWGIRDSESDAHQWGLLGRASAALARRLSRRADGIIINSVAGRDWYIRHGYPAAAFHVIPNGIDTDRFQPRTDHRRVLRREWGITSDDTFVFGIVGRLDPMKDHPTFLRAAALALKANPQLRFVVVGNGSADYTAHLKSLATDLHLDPALTWCPARQDMPHVYSALDAVVSSSSFGEGFSNVLGEAMACARPCIATDVGDSAMLIGDTGLICHPSSAEKLADSLQILVTLAGPRCNERGCHARQRILDHFTLNRMIARTASVCGSYLPRLS